MWIYYLVSSLHGSKVAVYLTDLGHAIIEYILPKLRKRKKKGTRKGTARGRARERERQAEIGFLERARWQPGHWRNKIVDFIRPDGRIEAKDVGWCVDNRFKKVRMEHQKRPNSSAQKQRVFSRARIPKRSPPRRPFGLQTLRIGGNKGPRKRSRRSQL